MWSFLAKFWQKNAKIISLHDVLEPLKHWQDRTIYHHRGAEILADPAKATLVMIFLRFVGFGYLP